MDIVERLRNNADERFAVWQIVTTMNEAADEIERLRERVKELATALEFEANYDGHKLLARSALQQTQPSHAQMSDDKGQR